MTSNFSSGHLDPILAVKGDSVPAANFQEGGPDWNTIYSALMPNK